MGYGSVGRPSNVRAQLVDLKTSSGFVYPQLCVEAEREISGALGHSKVMIDAHIVISDDVAKEIIIHAGKCKSRLIYMGASERSLAGQLILGSPLERVLLDAPCDVGVYRGLS
jgi:nucleotide-binding universal stress UspA family protein